MKKRLFFCMFTSWISQLSMAQTSVEFVPFSGYTPSYQMSFFNENQTDVTNITGRLDGGFNFGGSVLFNKTRRFGIEFLYNRLQTPAKLYNSDAAAGTPPYYQTSAGINYIMAGLVTNFPLHRSPSNSPVNIFFGFDLGISLTTPSPNVLSSSNVNFAMGLQTGVNYYVSPRIGIRLTARVTGSPESFSNYYFGDWGGNRGWFAIFMPGIVLAGINVGIIIGLGKELPEYQKLVKKERHHRHRNLFHK
jgi:hypothetical protein